MWGWIVVIVSLLGLLVLFVGGAVYAVKAFADINDGEGGTDYPEM